MYTSACLLRFPCTNRPSVRGAAGRCGAASIHSGYRVRAALPPHFSLWQARLRRVAAFGWSVGRVMACAATSFRASCNFVSITRFSKGRPAYPLSVLCPCRGPSLPTLLPGVSAAYCYFPPPPRALLHVSCCLSLCEAAGVTPCCMEAVEADSGSRAVARLRRGRCAPSPPC